MLIDLDGFVTWKFLIQCTKYSYSAKFTGSFHVLHDSSTTQHSLYEYCSCSKFYPVAVPKLTCLISFLCMFTIGAAVCIDK